MKSCVYSAVAVFCVGVGAANAECKVSDFAIKDFESIASDTKISLALLSLVTKEQYETAKQSISTAGSYAKIFEGSLDWSDFRERLNKELAYSSYNYDLQTTTRYVSQRLSPSAAQLYDTCMRSDANVVGLRMWLGSRDGPYYSLRAMWVGGTTEPSGTLRGVVEDGVKAVSDVPTTWPRAFPHELLVRKSSPDNAAAAFVINVDGTSANFVIVPDPVLKEYDLSAVVLAPIGMKSGGNWAPGLRINETCVPPPAGSTWVRGSAKLNNFKTSIKERGKAWILSQDEYSICWHVEVSTGAREIAEWVEAGVIATLRTPKPELPVSTPPIALIQSKSAMSPQQLDASTIQSIGLQAPQ